MSRAQKVRPRTQWLCQAGTKVDQEQFTNTSRRSEAFLGEARGGCKCSQDDKKIPEKSGLAVGFVFLLSYYASIQDRYCGQISGHSAVGFNCYEGFKFGQIRFFWPKWSNFSELNFGKNIFSRYNWSTHLCQISDLWPVGKYFFKNHQNLALN